MSDRPNDKEKGLGRAADRLRSSRSRLRSNQHRDAHDDAPESAERAAAKQAARAHPLVPGGKATLIDDQAKADALFARLAGADRFAFDTEFIGESTYHPKLCLVQIATADELALVDPIAGVKLDDFWQLLGNAKIEKIVHAGEQDLEPAMRLAGVAPQNVFDTQIVGGFCRLPYPASLAKLVEYVTSTQFGGEGVRLGKGLTFTQWDQRPLSNKQLSYAADDVRYLLLIADWLRERLTDGDDGELRHAWAVAECAARAADAVEPAGEPWERVKGGGSLDGRQQAILRRLAVWRDQAAQDEDLPPRVLVQDQALIHLARRGITDPARLNDVKYLPRPVSERYGMAIIEQVKAGKADDAVAVQRGAPIEPTLEDRFVADSAWAMLQTIAHIRGMDPNLIASRRETEWFVRRVAAGSRVEEHPLMQGWRRDAVGDRLLDLLGGGSLTVQWPGQSQ